MKLYPQDVQKYASELIEKYPGTFSTNVATNLARLENLLAIKVDTKQEQEKMILALASTIAAIMRNQLLGVKTRPVRGTRTKQRKKSKKARRPK